MQLKKVKVHLPYTPVFQLRLAESRGDHGAGVPEWTPEGVYEY